MNTIQSLTLSTTNATAWVKAHKLAVFHYMLAAIWTVFSLVDFVNILDGHQVVLNTFLLILDIVLCARSWVLARALTEEGL